jgi:hypothetical protein
VAFFKNVTVDVSHAVISSKLSGDKENEVGIERILLSDFEALIANGRLGDARVIAVLYLTRSFVQAQSASL